MRTSDKTLLQRLLDASGLSSEAFARDVAARDGRSLRRWRSGELELPNALCDWLARVEAIDVTDERVTIRVRRHRSRASGAHRLQNRDPVARPVGLHNEEVCD